MHVIKLKRFTIIQIFNQMQLIQVIFHYLLLYIRNVPFTAIT